MIVKERLITLKEDLKIKFNHQESPCKRDSRNIFIKEILITKVCPTLMTLAHTAKPSLPQEIDRHKKRKVEF